MPEGTSFETLERAFTKENSKLINRRIDDLEARIAYFKHIVETQECKLKIERQFQSLIVTRCRYLKDYLNSYVNCFFTCLLSTIGPYLY